ncbi:MAG: FecR domain-containing protein [Hyphomonadaceae bacterium]|nr:FecR domain-containing protein [Hyphomonadaceae bacterium]
MPSDVAKPSRQDQAAAWFAAERAGVMLVEQRVALDAWRADPRNQAALDAMYELWDDLAVLKGNEPAPRKVAQRSLLPIAAAVLVLVIGGVAASSWFGRPGDTTITTFAGEQKTQSMPDGSVIAVNVASGLTYKVTDSQRLVTIKSGEAAFSVRPDAAKPFVVRAGTIEVRAVGTSFNVRERDGLLQVAVSEGKVQICKVAASGDVSVLAVLVAGQLLEMPVTFDGAMPALSPISVPAAQVSEWRMRIVTYEDATVGEVVEDFNRYFEQKLVVEKPELLTRRVTIRLQVEDRARAIETLAGLLGARVIKTDKGDALSD